MSENPRHMPDGQHSFADLRDLWHRGSLTLEECLTQTLYTMIRFEARKVQLDLKTLQYRMQVWDTETWQTYEELREQVKSEALMEAMKYEKKNSDEAVEFILDYGVLLEMKLLQAERQWDEMMRTLDETPGKLDLN